MYYTLPETNNKNFKKDEFEKNQIILSITKTKMDLNNCIKNYEFAEDNLVDYYLYQIKANQAKLDYLLKKAKEKNINMKENFKSKYWII